MSKVDLFLTIATKTANQQAIRSLLDLQDHTIDKALAGNPNLNMSTRKLLLKRGLAPVAEALALSAVGDEQVSHVLKDKRKYTRATVLSNSLHTASNDLVREVLPTLTREDANKAITLITPSAARSGSFVKTSISKDLLRQIASKATFAYSFALLPDEALYPYADLLVELSNPDMLKIYPDFNELADTRPFIIPTLLDMARARKIRDPLLRPLLLALVTSRHIFDQSTFKELVAISSALHHTQRTLVLHTLGGNPNLGAEGLQHLVHTLTRYPTQVGCGTCAELLKRAKKLTHNPNLLLTTPWERVKDPEQLAVLKPILENPTAFLNFPSLVKPAKPYANPNGSGVMDLQKLDLGNYVLALPPKEQVTSAHASHPLTYEIFEARIYPELKELGLPGWGLFFRLGAEWKSNAATLLETVISLSK